VEILRADVKITADAVIGRYDANNRLQTIVCEDNVVVTRGEDLRASSDRAVYHVPTATIVLTEGPELARGGNVLSADKITVFVNEDKSEAEGNVRVKVIQEGEGTSLLEKARSDRETGAKGGAQETTQE
jgi:lipopolysaccharide transport protein LptA